MTFRVFIYTAKKNQIPESSHDEESTSATSAFHTGRWRTDGVPMAYRWRTDGVRRAHLTRTWRRHRLPRPTASPSEFRAPKRKERPSSSSSSLSAAKEDDQEDDEAQ